VVVALDVAMVNLAFYLAWYARYRLGLFVALDPGNYLEHDAYLPLQVTLSLAFAFIIALRGLYRLPRAASALDDLSTIFSAAGVSVMLLFAGSTFVRYPAESRLTLIFAWGLITLLVVLGRANFVWMLGVLHHLSASGPLTVGELATHLGLSKATATELVTRVQERGLVDRMRDERDQRRVKRYLRQPVGGEHVAIVAVRHTHGVEAVGEHTQRGLSGSRIEGGVWGKVSH